MWLDRLAAGGQASAPGPSTPQPSSRPYSPLPRRTSSALSPYVTSQRAGQSPRSSSLSLVSNDSTSSLLLSRKPNGSGLKQSSTIGPASDSREVLEALLASSASPEPPLENQKIFINEDDIDFDAEFGGLSLKELAASQPPETTVSSNRRPQTVVESRDIRTQSKNLIANGPITGESERTKLEDLHRSIAACDDVLNSVENNLTSFRNDLATVSSDIESLQARSTALNRRLENRKEVEKALGPMVEELSLPPEVISKISEGHIDDTWAKMLAELDRRASSFKKKTESQQSNASKDLGPLLERLTLKV